MEKRVKINPANGKQDLTALKGSIRKKKRLSGVRHELERRLAIQIQNNEHLVRNVKVRPKNWSEKRPRLTTGRTSAMVATESQMTPLHKEEV